MVDDAGLGGVDTLRLVWPSWQAAGTESVEAFAPEFSLEEARRGYEVGTRVLEAILPPHPGSTARIDVPMGDDGLALRDGVEAKDAIVAQQAQAQRVIAGQRWSRIVTLGGDCSASIAPFTALAERYGDELAVVWIDSHPDVGTPDSEYKGFHAMAVSAITGHGVPEVLDVLPATVPAERVALTGLHSWTDDDFPNASAWGVSAFSPEALRETTEPLLAWLRGTGCSKVAIHLDVDVIDSDEVVLGLGIEPGGLRIADVRRIVSDVAGAADVVGLTVAEYIPRQVMHARALLAGFPLLS
ncbi:arginase family protein [Demequina salsinemoris]|uniref:arginase family protein n=1 Tax=Demequina salsinemoris TaxID=577470 RepID=UPI000785DEDF|nr:arginase family protein [Demequina salsinemoris]